MKVHDNQLTCKDQLQLKWNFKETVIIIFFPDIGINKRKRQDSKMTTKPNAATHKKQV